LFFDINNVLHLKMSLRKKQLYNIDNETLVTIANAITNVGYVIIENALPYDLIDELFQRITSLNTSDFQNAKVGQGIETRLIEEIRNDITCWLDYDNSIDKKYLSYMNSLQSKLNSQLFLGLFEFECHYSIYRIGSFYKKHSDVLGNSNSKNYQFNKTRILSSILYLNKHWDEYSGGELILYDKHNESELKTIYPKFGSLILFLSEDFPHEVKPTQQIRYSIAGWFRANST